MSEEQKPMTPVQEELYRRIELRNGGDRGYANLDWKLVEDVISEATSRGANEMLERVVRMVKTMPGCWCETAPCDCGSVEHEHDSGLSDLLIGLSSLKKQ